MNYLWPIIILISFLFAIFNGTMQDVNNSIFSSVADVVTLSFTLVGNMCLWCGLMNIIQETKLMNFLIKLLIASYRRTIFLISLLLKLVEAEKINLLLF